MKFELIDHETLYQGRAFDVQRVQARLPNGVLRHYDLVDHRAAVTLVPVDEQGRIWFVRQYRVGAQSELLELPAGVMEAGEDPETCAAREIREEIGMAARQLRSLGNFFLAPGYSNEYMHIFLATGLYPAPLPADADEFLQCEPFPARQAYDLAAAGQIQDGKSLAALLLAHPFLGNLD